MAALVITSIVAGCWSTPTIPAAPRKPIQSTASSDPAAPAHLTGRILRDGVAMTDFGVTLAPSLDDIELAKTIEIHTRDGRFDIGVSAGDYDLVIAGPGFARKTLHVTTSPSQPTRLGSVAVTRGQTIDGRVTDKAGTPLGGIAVHLYQSTMRQWTGMHALAVGDHDAVTDDDGRYRITDYARIESAYNAGYLVASRPGVSAAGPRQLEEGLANTELVMQDVGMVEGTVHAPSLELSSVVVYLVSEGKDTVSMAVACDEAGEFRFADVPEGPYRVTAAHDRHATRVVVSPGNVETLQLVIP